jgi:hypothetical protein
VRQKARSNDFQKKESFTIQTNKIEGEWLVAMLAKSSCEY